VSRLFRRSVEERRAEAEWTREQRAADQAASAAGRAQRRAELAERRADRSARLHRVGAAVGSRLVFIWPLLVVTGFAVYGQVGYGLAHYTPADAPDAYRLAIAVGAAVGIESIANYVQWHAHQARLAGADATANRLARYSYLIALGVAAINYAHFAKPDLSPTAGALVFAAFSASSPWLWSLHTRRAEYEKLREDGLLDEPGARFRSERWKHFPIQTWRARRYSILHNITDPAQAWATYQAAHRADVVTRTAERATRRAAHHTAAGGNPVRALGVRLAGVIAPPPAGVTGGVLGGAAAGVKPTARGGVTGGVTPVRPAPQAAGETATGETAGAAERTTPRPARSPSSAHPTGPELLEVATQWARAHTARREPIPGWRLIVKQFPALSEHFAKEAARLAKQPADTGPLKLTVVGHAAADSAAAR